MGGPQAKDCLDNLMRLCLKMRQKKKNTQLTHLSSTVPAYKPTLGNGVVTG